MASAEVDLIQEGKLTVRVMATFANLDANRDAVLTRSTPPRLAPPDTCLAVPKHARILSAASIADRMECRFEQLPGWATGEPTGSACTEFWIRFRDDRPADTLSLPMIVDAAPPVVFELGAKDSSTIQLHVHVRGRPSPGWLACRAQTRNASAGLHDEDFEVWDSAGCLVAQGRQLAML